MVNELFNYAYTLAAKGDLPGIQQVIKLNPHLLTLTTPGHNRTILWIAVRRNRGEIVDFLLNQGADVNIPGRVRSESFVLIKPYCVAWSLKRKLIASALKAYGNVLDGFSMAYLGMLEPLKNLIQKEPQIVNQEQPEDKIWQVTLLHFALSGGHLPTTELLIKHDAVVRPYSSLLLDISARKNRLDLVRLLLRAGADGSAVPPYSAILSNSSEMLELFVGEGLEINNREDAWPVLVYVCRGDKGEHPKRVKCLLDHGADVNIRAQHNHTALHMAARAGFNTIVNILLKYGADASVVNDAGFTPRDLALKAKRFETASLLQSYS